MAICPRTEDFQNLILRPVGKDTILFAEKACGNLAGVFKMAHLVKLAI
jgi:hypothetical protein